MNKRDVVVIRIKLREEERRLTHSLVIQNGGGNSSLIDNTPVRMRFVVKGLIRGEKERKERSH